MPRPGTTPADPALDPPPASARALVERRLVMLGRLTDIGMEIAEEAGRLAKAAPEDRGGADPALMYSRAARAVRLTLALQSRLLEERDALDKRAADAEAARLSDRKRHIMRRVDRALEEACDSGHEVTRLSMYVWERLVDEDDYADIAAIPFEEAVARICEQLGVSPATSAWALAEAAGEPSDDDEEIGKAPPDFPASPTEAAAGPDRPPNAAVLALSG